MEPKYPDVTVDVRGGSRRPLYVVGSVCSALRGHHLDGAASAFAKVTLQASAEQTLAIAKQTVNLVTGEDWMDRSREVLELVMDERIRQVARYGHNEKNYDGSGPGTRWLGPYTQESASEIEETVRRDYEDYEDETGAPTWVHLIREEVAEAFAEDDPDRLQAELVQVAALCVSWVEQLRIRGAQPVPNGEDNGE